MRERDSSHSLDPMSFFVCVDKHSKCKQSFVDTTKLVENWQSSGLTGNIVPKDGMEMGIGI